jgi:hypothetical protein
VIILLGCSKNSGRPSLPDLIETVEQARRLSVEAIEGYAPKVRSQIDGLAAPAAETLVSRRCPFDGSRSST